ncbi:MAG TPA: TIGR01777 family oxidoreductase [Pseudomonadota bacterium]|nr:TIGR01777 family oxidoreductase [Pseudomonadota bacterium]
MNAFVTGATGFVGKRLLRRLFLRGDHVSALTRNRRHFSSAIETERLHIVEGDPGQPGPWQAQCANMDALVTLAGEPLFAQRWSTSVKDRLLDSRVESARQMCAALSQLPPEQRPKTWVAASAIGFYGSRGDEAVDEKSGPGDDFLSRLCVRWEEETQKAASLGVRVVLLRIGIVLGNGGGVLAKMVPPFRAFVGGPLGSGQQFVSWIHLDDLIGLIEFALETPSVSGPLNATAPKPVRMTTFAKTLGDVLHRPSRLAVPALALRLALGEAADVMLASQRVFPERALSMGYAFQYAELPAALHSLLPSE